MVRYRNVATVFALVAGILPLGTSLATGQGSKRLPSGKSLRVLVEDYLEADEARRDAIRDRADRDFKPLVPGKALTKLRSDLLKITAQQGPDLNRSGTHYFYDEKTRRGKYIVRGRPGPVLFVGLHGGGLGSGEAESSAASMGGGGWFWIFPEVLEKTEFGWSDAGTDRFVLELIEAAKRTFRVDPNRIYVTGHSMGGEGAWRLAAYHADVFGGAASYAGALTPFYRSRADRTVVDIESGVLPNLYNLAFFFYQSLDDPNVPADSNLFTYPRMLELREQHPTGFNFRYVQVDGRGHSAPAEGYLPTQKWVASHPRVARPPRFLWEPLLDWKRHFYWLYWSHPEAGTVLQCEAKTGNKIEITTLKGDEQLQGLTVLLGEPLVDLGKEVVVAVNGEEEFRGSVERTFSTLLLTLPRNDDELLFDARIDLD